MAEENTADGGVDKVKACSSCGATWPANRPICPACGTGLAGVTARPADELAGEGEFDWQWLDALAPEDDEPPERHDKPEKEQSKRAWWQFWR